jgi:membrane protein YdbS with pleckstrin-like domain
MPEPQPAPQVHSAVHKPADDHEEVYYEGSPLLRGELGRAIGFLLGAVVCAGLGAWAIAQSGGWFWVGIVLMAAAPILFLIPIILTKTIRYRISNYRIDVETGLLSKRIDTLELWHVDDVTLDMSLTDRMLGVGTVTVQSHDDTTPVLPLRSLPQPRKLFENLKQRVIAVKRQRGVIKVDTGT